eukprot:TRINITY_DN67714_c8_g6_i1.p1 TRINITY_DN67714_c8_g6~~TRINITY_DN67714_c8_g6_i1.p1  ORF type:complete len:333 (+),score=58.76 TRINITY_DN67714_c8_g6_i1:30-1028(+)
MPLTNSRSRSSPVKGRSPLSKKRKFAKDENQPTLFAFGIKVSPPPKPSDETEELQSNCASPMKKLGLDDDSIAEQPVLALEQPPSEPQQKEPEPEPEIPSFENVLRTPERSEKRCKKKATPKRTLPIDTLWTHKLLLPQTKVKVLWNDNDSGTIQSWYKGRITGLNLEDPNKWNIKYSNEEETQLDPSDEEYKVLSSTGEQQKIFADICMRHDKRDDGFTHHYKPKKAAEEQYIDVPSFEVIDLEELRKQHQTKEELNASFEELTSKVEEQDKKLKQVLEAAHLTWVEKERDMFKEHDDYVDLRTRSARHKRKAYQADEGESLEVDSDEMGD